MTPHRSASRAIEPPRFAPAGGDPGKIVWQLRSAAAEGCRRLTEALRIHPATARVLAARGCSTPASATRFLDPTWDDILDPAQLPDFDRAIARTIKAVRDGERIMVFGDYDVDGVMATAILSNAIRIVGGQATWKIPHRLVDGYGMRENHVEAARHDRVRLIVTGDSGIRSHGAVQCANGAGIDVIITDHHLPEASLPAALAVVNPARGDSFYENRNLCGAGVAFQFAAGIFRARQVPEQRAARFLRSFCKLAAIGTVADVVPLVGENRTIVSLGLRSLSDVRNVGLRTLLDAIGIPHGRTPSARDVAFRLAPRINAAGRMEDASLIMELLGATDRDTAERLVGRVEQLNDRRKAEQSRVLTDIANIASTSDLKGPVLVFSRQGWHRGVLGIAAARLVDEHSKPVFVLSEEDGMAHGSGRSVPGIDLTGLLERTRHHLEAFGGHEQAAGLTIRCERIRAFRDEICTTCAGLRPARVLDVDSQLRLAEAARVWSDISRLEPFGNGNPEPVFATRVRVATPLVAMSSRVARFGAEQGGQIYQVKHFGVKLESGRLTPGDHVDLAYRLQRDSWRPEGFAIVMEAMRPAL